MDEIKIKPKRLTMKQKCKRCGYIGDLLEKHHKKQKVAGGSDANPNRIWYCIGCHDYEHARRNIIEAIKSEQSRLDVLNKRLEILDRLNTPERIMENGYQGYFQEFKEILPSPSIWVFFTWYAGVGYGIASIIGLLLLRFMR
jgi:hypothetical protein